MNWRRVAHQAALWITGGLSAAILLFLLAAWIGSSIPRNSDWIEAEDGVEIMIETNGIHTAIVMPLVNAQKDWRASFPAYHLEDPSRPYTHVSVSWGERDVFLDTPTWWDLSPATAFGAATGGDGLLHVAHYVRPAPSETARPVTLRPEEYTRLVRRIKSQILPGDSRAIYPGYDDYDVFYDAPGRYNFANTCNQWIADTLAFAGVKIGRWTPLAGGVMKWFDPPAEADA